MGLLDIFLSKDKRGERSRAKNVARAVNKYAQSGDRLKALESLASDGSDEALYGMLRRFGLMYDKSIEDEQEKEWVFETLVGKGPAALPAVKRYLLSAESISWPLRVLDAIADKDTELAFLEEVLARHEPGYERDPTKKIQLLAHLGGLTHAKAPSLVAPYLKDMDEGVRFTAVEALIKLKDEGVAKRPLLELFASAEEESLRIRLKIAEGLAELGWAVPDDLRAAVIAKLPDAHSIDKSGQFKKK
jgi:HEAT repeat protein